MFYCEDCRCFTECVPCKTRRVRRAMAENSKRTKSTQPLPPMTTEFRSKWANDMRDAL